MRRRLAVLAALVVRWGSPRLATAVRPPSTVSLRGAEAGKIVNATVATATRAPPPTAVRGDLQPTHTTAAQARAALQWWGAPPIAWDPPELRAGWWTEGASSPSQGSPPGEGLPGGRSGGGNSSRPGAPQQGDSRYPAPACDLAAERCGVTMVGPMYGQTSNVLMEWGALMRLAAYSPPSTGGPRAVIIDSIFEQYVGDGFDVVAATRGWACVFNPWLPEGSEGKGWFEPSAFPEGGGEGSSKACEKGVTSYRAKTMFEDQSQGLAGLRFVTKALHQLLLRPSEELRRLVDDFAAKEGLYHDLRGGDDGEEDGGGDSGGYIGGYIRGDSGGGDPVAVTVARAVTHTPSPSVAGRDDDENEHVALRGGDGVEQGRSLHTGIATRAAAVGVDPSASATASRGGGVLKGGFVAIHLRGMDGGCEKRLDPSTPGGRAAASELVDVSPWLGRPVVASDVCEMSTAYVEAVLASRGGAPPGTRFVLCHDNSQAAHALRIVERFNASVFTDFGGGKRNKVRNAVLVDMLLGIRSALFIGNPASSFSRTVAAVRKVASRQRPTGTRGPPAGASGDLGLASAGDARSNLVGDYIRNF